MYIEIISPEAKLYQGEVQSAKLPGAKGQFQVLKGHAPIMSSLEAGVITLQTTKGEEHFDVKGGVVEVNKDKIIVLV
ncbi:ATP synthase F1 subunit epsilon [bacterium]|nr:ATP synthase F1 subunit epsilon [bacterium]